MGKRKACEGQSLIGKGRRAERDKRCEGELECKGVRRGREVGKKEVFWQGRIEGRGKVTGGVK